MNLWSNINLSMFSLLFFSGIHSAFAMKRSREIVSGSFQSELRLNQWKLSRGENILSNVFENLKTASMLRGAIERGATEKGNFEFAQLLITELRRADYSMKCNDGLIRALTRELCMVAKSGHIKGVEFLIAELKKVYGEDLRSSEYCDLLARFIKIFTCDHPDFLYRSPLSLACENGHFKVAQLFIAELRRYANYNMTCKNGLVRALTRELCTFAKIGHIEGVKFLITELRKLYGEYSIPRFIDVFTQDHPDFLYRSPLSLACENGHLEVVQLFVAMLREKLAAYQFTSALKDSLELACKKGRLEVVQFLMTVSKEVSSEYYGGEYSFICNIISEGSAFNASDKKRLFEVACEEEQLEVVQLLITILKETYDKDRGVELLRVIESILTKINRPKVTHFVQSITAFDSYFSPSSFMPSTIAFSPFFNE